MSTSPIQMSSFNSNMCDLCESPASRMWDEYPMCESCWIHLAESQSDEPPVCEECHHKPATEIFNRLDGVSLDLCDACFMLADHEPISSGLCEMCSESRAAHPIRISDGQRVYVCTPCFETSQQRKAPNHTICEECDQKFASIVITRDEKTTIDVCEGCYDMHWAPKKAAILCEPKPIFMCDTCDSRPYTHSICDDGEVQILKLEM